MSQPKQIKIAACYMRGGTSKGVFFKLSDLPKAAQVPGATRDALILRVIGSPDPYGKHTDGMGGATSSTSKAVILSKSAVPEHDVDYLFGQVAIDKPVVDWSGNCGNLTAAVGAFAISSGLVADDRIPKEGHCTVRVWQANIQKSIMVTVPIQGGVVQECGDFNLDGVTFPAAEVGVEFLDPAGGDQALFPTGAVQETLVVDGIGELKATLITAGIPTVFIDAEQVGYTGIELQDAINNDELALAKFEKIRAAGALKMGLIQSLEEASTRQHTPKVAFVAKPQSYLTSSNASVSAESIDLNVRALSMGKLHHAMMGTAAVAIATAAAIPGTLVNDMAGGGERDEVVFGHPSGTLKVGARVKKSADSWEVAGVSMSRSARVLMEGWVRIPETAL